MPNREPMPTPLCEYKVLKALGRPAKDPTEDLDFFDTEMDNCTDEYCTYVMEQLQEAGQYCKDPDSPGRTEARLLQMGAERLRDR